MDESISPCNIRVDRDGVWYYQGAEIIRKDILEMFYRSMEMDKQGRYLIKMGEEVCFLEVEDTPWIVKEVSFIAGSGERPSAFYIRLSDNSVEDLNLKEIWIGDKNVLYCKVKSGRFRARFSRPAYYEFSRYIQDDENTHRYFVSFNGKNYVIVNKK